MKWRKDRDGPRSGLLKSDGFWMFGGSFWAWRVCGPWAGFWRCCCPGGWGGVKSRLVGRFRAFWPHSCGPVLMPRAACSEAVRLPCLFAPGQTGCWVRPCAEGEALGAARSAAGRSPAPLGILFCPLWGSSSCSFRGKCRAPGCWLSGRRPAGVAGGGPDAKRWGTPQGCPSPGASIFRGGLVVHSPHGF